MSGAIEIDSTKQTVRFNGGKTKLPNYSFQLLRLLAAHAPDPVSFERIEQAVWGARASRETIKQRVRLLRNSLRDIGAPQDAVEAAHSIGYRLAIPAIEIDGADPTPRRPRASTRIAAAACMLAALIAAAWLLWPRAAAVQGPLRVAVVNEFAVGDDAGVDIDDWVGVNRMLAGGLSRLQGVEALATVSSDAVGAARAREAARFLSADMIVSSAMVERNDTVQLSFQLIDGATEAILRSDDYEYSPGDYSNAVEHFIRNVHLALARTDRRLQQTGEAPSGERERNAYYEALELAEVPTEGNLRAAVARLDPLIEREPSFSLARALRARIHAELVVRHGYGADLAADALREARVAAEAAPAIAEIKYALARAEIAVGEDYAALAHLREAARHLPYVGRDIDALERQLAVGAE